MNHIAPARAGSRWAAGLVLTALVVAIAALFGTLVERSASSSPPSSSDVRRGHHGGATTEDDGVLPDDFDGTPRGGPVAPRGGAVVPADVGAGSGNDGVVTEADGVLPDDVTVFDDEYPGIANLEPALLQALREAATDAAGDGIEFHVNSGWRSPEYQSQLLREAVSTYGSEEAAARWVATADTSAHVSGNAVDIGPYDAAAWLSEHGAHYGLCQIYRNESWHYELRPAATHHGCPRMYAGASHGPGMRP